MNLQGFLKDGVSPGSILGVRIVVGPTFFLLMLLIPLLGLSYYWVGLVFSFVLMHEFAHILAGNIFGMRTPTIRVFMFGMAALQEITVPSSWRNLIVYAAGPASNFIAALILISLSTFLGNKMLMDMVYVNIALGIFNLIPIFPMDGAGIINCALRMAGLGNTWINHIMFTITTVCGVIMLIFAISSKAFILMALVAFLWVNALNMWKAGRLFVAHIR